MKLHENPKLFKDAITFTAELTRPEICIHKTTSICIKMTE
jgi:hypothetical protein